MRIKTYLKTNDIKLFICSYVFKEVNNQMSKKIDDQIIELANEMVDKFGTDYIIELRKYTEYYIKNMEQMRKYYSNRLLLQ